MKLFSKYSVFIIIVLAAFAAGGQKKDDAKSKAAAPTLFIIGDSTVNNSGEGFQGWGNVVADLFDETKIRIENRARGGRSSRTFYTEGLWEKVLSELKPGDFVLMQFGHNDGGPIDREKYRGSIRGTGEETQNITGVDGKPETIHTFGWYMRKYIADAKSKGATAIVLSPVPRNVWKDGKVERAAENYGKWAREAAETEKVLFIDLNEITARKYEKEGAERVGAAYFTTKDHTHTSAAGARVNAESVVEGLRALKKNPLKKYLK
ncbi:MAG TPA: rhamnogalacturonan acetylesterase [Pyrinomonadaceae bacterium]|jgi:lysophospholipase L1-like esterase